jgi:hypothetical protein
MLSRVPCGYVTSLVLLPAIYAPLRANTNADGAARIVPILSSQPSRCLYNAVWCTGRRINTMSIDDHCPRDYRLHLSFIA